METGINTQNKFATVFFLFRIGKFTPIRQHQFHDLLGYLADFGKHRSPVTAMHPTIGKRRNPSDIATILVTPLDNLRVAIRNLFNIFFHGFSSKAFLI